MVNPHVPQVNLKADGSVDVIVQIVHIDAGHWADVSGYVIQEATAPGTEIDAINILAPFSATLVVPNAPAGGGDPTVTVNVPGLNLNPAAGVKVVVRVTEAMIWPTTLRNAVAAHLPNVTATWEAIDDVPGAAGPYRSLSTAVPTTDPDPSFSLRDMRIGYKYKITIEAVPK